MDKPEKEDLVMAAKDTCYVPQRYVVKRFEKSVTINGQSVFFEQPVTDSTWFNLLKVLEGFAANVYNEGVANTQKNIREALGL